VRILLPGDEGYDDVQAARPPEGAGQFNDAIRSISKAANQEGGPTHGGVSVPSGGVEPA
jgi:hypothetical protein